MSETTISFTKLAHGYVGKIDGMQVFATESPDALGAWAYGQAIAATGTQVNAGELSLPHGIRPDNVVEISDNPTYRKPGLMASVRKAVTG